MGRKVISCLVQFGSFDCVRSATSPAPVHIALALYASFDGLFCPHPPCQLKIRSDSVQAVKQPEKEQTAVKGANLSWEERTASLEKFHCWCFTFWLKSESPTCPFGIGFIKSGPSNISLWKWWVRVTSTPPQEPALILSWGRISLKIDVPWKMWNIWFLCSALGWLSQWEGSSLGVKAFPHDQKLSKLPSCLWRIFTSWMSRNSSWKLW